jgi:PadR family transcriptional regulator PadR
MLTRMLDEGWLTDGWEEDAATRPKRPPRRYYEITDEGRRLLGALLRESQDDARFRDLNLEWA